MVKTTVWYRLRADILRALLAFEGGRGQPDLEGERANAIIAKLQEKGWLPCGASDGPALLRRSATIVGSQGGKARAKALTAKQRTEIASKAARARWGKAGK